MKCRRDRCPDAERVSVSVEREREREVGGLERAAMVMFGRVQRNTAPCIHAVVLPSYVTVIILPNGTNRMTLSTPAICV